VVAAALNGLQILKSLLGLAITRGAGREQLPSRRRLNAPAEITPSEPEIRVNAGGKEFRMPIPQAVGPGGVRIRSCGPSPPKRPPGRTPLFSSRSSRKRLIEKASW